MTITEKRPATEIAGAGAGEYPTLFRLGHKYEIALGQRDPFTSLMGPLDLAIGPDGWAYVLNRYRNALNVPRHRFVRVNIHDEGYENDIVPSENGQPIHTGADWLWALRMCTLDSEGTLFATDEYTNVVAMFKTTGETVGWWGETGSAPGQMHAPSGIALDADENLWIVDSYNHRVQHFTRDGRYLGGWGEFGTAPGQLNYPWGVAVDPINGTIVVADFRNDRIQRFSPEGESLQVFGKSGSGEGELNRPSGVAVDEHGDIYVADWRNHRVLSFNHRGRFLESFIGDATINERAVQKLMTNLDMLRMRDNIVNLDREKRLRYPVSVKVDGKGLVYIVDWGGFRVQVYRELCRVLSPDEVDPPTMHVDPVLT